MGGISNIFNNIKSDEKSSSNASLPQSIAKTATEDSSKIGNVFSPKSIGNDAASYKIAQNTKGNTADNTKEVMLNKYQKLIDISTLEKREKKIEELEKRIRKKANKKIFGTTGVKIPIGMTRDELYYELKDLWYGKAV